MAESTREDLLIMARIAEQAERYEDMAEAMRKVVAEVGGNPLSEDERNLLSVAYKNVVGTRRGAFRIVGSIEQKAKETSETAATASHARSYREEIKKELIDICNDVSAMLDKYILTKSGDETEAQVFYHKMKGDYCRYAAEVKISTADDDAAKFVQLSEAAYLSAQEASSSLPPTHPIRLGLALNFSVFYYEIALDQGKACELARKAFDEAGAELENLEDSSSYSFNDSMQIMQLLRDNLTLWNQDNPEVENLE